ncbi:MAG TPA: MarR family transcriptional regulator [Thermodesulfobacteriota bacterium]|nr:MarR family transcriptional regulator [Thermodesulfobacteriota bacterium]
MKGNVNVNELSRYEIAECAQCTGFNLKKATRIIQNRFDQAFKPVGLEGTQYTVLAHIFVHGPISLSKVAELMHVDRTTLARNLAPLERKDFIKIKPGIDRRSKIISITDKGMEVLAKALPLWKKTQAEIKETLGIENWSSMLSNLENLVTEMK